MRSAFKWCLSLYMGTIVSVGGDESADQSHLSYRSNTATKREQPRANFVLNRELLRPGEISGDAVS